MGGVSYIPVAPYHHYKLKVIMIGPPPGIQSRFPLNLRLDSSLRTVW